VPDTCYLVPDTWNLVPGTWHQLPFTWCLVLGTWCLVPGTIIYYAGAKYRCLVPGTRYQVSFTRHLVPGLRSGTRYLVPGTWPQVPDTRQYILVDTIFNCRFHFGLQENVFRKVQKIHLFGVGAQNVCFEDLNKDMFLKSKMKPVVKYGVY